MSKRIKWERIESVLAATTNVIAAWAFGSAQNGQIKPGGDIDIAVLFASVPTLDEQIDLLSELQQALHIDNIDLVVLNNANPILRFEAVSGRPVYCRDIGQRAEFVSLTAREYEDDIAFLQRAIAARS